MAFQHLTVRNGLSQNTIMDVLQDSHGYIWLATENGLDRFDGYDIRSYQRNPIMDGELVMDYIWQIAEDAETNLWLATQGGGLAKWHRDTDRFSHIRHDPQNPNSLSSDRVRTLLVTEQGIWVGTSDAGLNLVDPKTGHVERFQHDPDEPTSLPNDEVYALLTDTQGRLWVGTNEGLAWLQEGTRQFTRLTHDENNRVSLSNNRIRSLYQDRHGGIWVGTFGGGLNFLDRRTSQFRRFRADSNQPGSLSHDHVRDIFEDAAGRIWVGTANGLNVLAPYSDFFWQYHSGDRSESLADSYVMSIFEDSGGVLWIGTRGSGVSTWNSHSWYFGHNRADWFPQRSVTAFATHDRNFWVATFGNGVTQIDRVSGEISHLNADTTNSALPGNEVMSLLADSKGGLWAGTMNHGVGWRARGEDEFVVLAHNPEDENSLSANGIMSLFEDHSGTIWIGTYGRGITRFDPTQGEFTNFLPSETGFCGAQGRVFVQDSHRDLWIGTENGLCRLDATTKQFTAYRHNELQPDSLADDSVYALHIDTSNRLWVGTGHGGLSEMILNRTSQEVRFRTYNRRSGLSSNAIFGVLSDNDGYLWLSSNNGLMGFDPNSQQVRIYHKTHGLQDEEFNVGAAHKAGDGRLYFGGVNGFNAFEPHQLHTSDVAPQIVLTDVLKLNQSLQSDKPLSELSELHLEYRENAVTFEFAALDYTEPEDNQYRYRLEGFDTDWVEAGRKHSATYTNLDPGSYLFRVIGGSSQGAWNSEGLVVTLTVAPPPWASTQAYVLYLGVGFACLALLWRKQRRQAQQAQAYRTELENEVHKRTLELETINTAVQKASRAKGEFVAHISHEIRSPINGILGMTELLSRTPLNDRQTSFAQTIQSSTRVLLDIVNDILDFSKLESHRMTLELVEAELEPIVDDVISMLALQPQTKGVELITQLPALDLPRLKCDPLRLKQILVNLISNAIKFTEVGHIVLQVAIQKKVAEKITLEFAVTDTGVGIAPAHQAKIFDSFVQAENSTTRKYGGTGLGLSISRELVELMGGEITLTSKPGEGTTFSFSMSFDCEPSSIEPKSKMNALILAVGTEPALTSQLYTYGMGWGCDVIHVPSGQAALKSLSADNTSKPDIIVIDQRLPDMSGTSLIGMLHSEKYIEANHILLLLPVGSTDQLDLNKAHCLSLPIQRTALLNTFTNILAGKSATDMTDVDPAQTSLRQTHNARVLLVEDNEVNQEVFTGMLSELGCHAVVAEDGGAAVRLAKRESFDLILMDYRLPDFNGVIATGRIRTALSDQPHIPIIALTANASSEDRQRCLAGGMDDFLAKPSTLTDLAGMLNKWIATDPQSEVSRSENDFDEAAIINISKLKRQDGTPMLAHAALLFERLITDSTRDLQGAVQTNDLPRINFTAHKLKSACSNLGLNSLADLCRQLERLNDHSDAGSAERLLNQFNVELGHASKWLKGRINAHS